MKKLPKKILAVVLSFVFVLSAFLPATEVYAAKKPNEVDLKVVGKQKAMAIQLNGSILQNVSWIKFKTSTAMTIKFEVRSNGKPCKNLQVALYDKNGEKKLSDTNNVNVSCMGINVPYTLGCYAVKPNTTYYVKVAGLIGTLKVAVTMTPHDTDAKGKIPNTKAKAIKMTPKKTLDEALDYVTSGVILQGEKKYWYKIQLNTGQRLRFYCHHISVYSGKVLVTLKDSSGKILRKNTLTGTPTKTTVDKPDQGIYKDIYLPQGTYYLTVKGKTPTTNAYFEEFCVQRL